jgi:lipooligosaccharide transport system permease protein
MNTKLWGIYCVWLRYFKVFRKSFIYGVVTTFLEPILYLTSFGYGLGSMIGHIEVGHVSLSYRQFVFSGIVAQTVMFQGFFEASYGSFIRMYYQKIFQAIAMTPITLSELLWGEILWDASKATFSASVVLLIGCVTGDFNPLGALLCLPFCFICSLLFASFGLLVAAKSRTIEEISYPQYLVIFPMFLFCGVFFPIEQLPGFLQTFAWFLPLTPMASIIRTAVLDLPLNLWAIPVLLAWVIVLVPLARRFMISRLVK